MWLKNQEVHDVRMYECACTVNLEKGVVMSLTATRTITASQRRPLVLRPPQLCDNTNQEQQLVRRGCWYYYKERGRGESLDLETEV